jgi:hypothetical protein
VCGRRWLGGLVLALAIGCAGAVRPELFAIDDVHPERIGPGQRLTIRGEGFPPGREGRVRLRGTLHRPGGEQRPVDLALPARALSPEQLEAVFSQAILHELGGRGTFRGELEVVFASDPLELEVVGILRGVVLDFVPATQPPTIEEPRFATRIGLALGAPDGLAPGLPIRAVAEGSRAANAGLLPGDRILEVGGLRLFGTDDLDPMPNADEISFLVRRGDDFRPLRTIVDLRGLRAGAPATTLRLFQIAAVVWLLALLWFGPFASSIDRLAGAVRRRVPWGFAISSAAMAVALRSALKAFADLGVFGAMVAIATGRLAMMAFTATGSRARIAAYARGAGAMVSVAALVFSATLRCGSSDPDLLEAAQGWAPWDWNALRSPAGASAAILLVIAAACGPEAPCARVRALDDVALAGLAAGAAIALAGGVSAADRWVDSGPVLAVLSWAPYASVSAAIALVMRQARDWGASLGALPLFGMSLAASAVVSGIALGWAALDVPLEVERAVGEVLFIAAVVLTVRFFTAPPPAPARALHPLL